MLETNRYKTGDKVLITYPSGNSYLVEIKDYVLGRANHYTVKILNKYIVEEDSLNRNIQSILINKELKAKKIKNKDQLMLELL